MIVAAVARGSARADIEDIILETQAQLERIVRRGGGAALEELLGAAETDLRKRLERAHRGGLENRWTGQQIAASRMLVNQAVRDLQARMTQQLDIWATANAKAGMKDTVRALSKAERVFKGSLAHPLALEDAMRFSNTLNGVRSSLLRQHATSVDRYGARMIGQFERVMQLGILGQKTTEQMIDELVGLRGPRGRAVSIVARVKADGSVERVVERASKDGLFVENRWWAERIVRTEMANALNAGAQAAIEEELVDFPDMKRILVETFDRRTGEDSVYAHGEIRGPREMFLDGAGREYLHPPGRPNDRGRIVPWREAWGKPQGALAAKNARTRNAAAKTAGGGTQGPTGAPPTPPLPAPAPTPSPAQQIAQRAAAVQAVRAQHLPATYEPQYAHLGQASKSVAWGRAAMERGLDFPLEHALNVASRIKDGPLATLPAFLASEIAQLQAPPRTLRELMQGMQIQGSRDSLHVAAALVGHLDGILPAHLPIRVRSKGAGPTHVAEKKKQVERFMSLVDQSVPFLNATVDVTRGNGRAHFNPGTRIAQVAALRPEATLWHELGHAIEEFDPVALARGVDLREQRAIGQRARPLNVILGTHRYGPREVAKEDQFTNPYTGKLYSLAGKDYATETTSMGLTVLGENWRAGWKDQEHLLFTLGQLGPR